MHAVTGITGQVGGTVAQTLLATGEKVRKRDVDARNDLTSITASDDLYRRIDELAAISESRCLLACWLSRDAADSVTIRI